MFTRCPNCQTTYRVHSEQLSSANGLVRCGKCEEVFQSLDHLFEIKHSPYPMTSPVPVSAEQADEYQQDKAVAAASQAENASPSEPALPDSEACSQSDQIAATLLQQKPALHHRQCKMTLRMSNLSWIQQALKIWSNRPQQMMRIALMASTAHRQMSA